MTTPEPITVERLLTRTRSARKTLDLSAPIDVDEVAACLRTGLHAPNGSNQQSWRWLLIADAERRATIAELYRESYLGMTGGMISDQLSGDTEFGRVMSSTEWLVEHLAEVPLFVIPCYEPYVPRGETDGDEQFFQATLYGSIFPAVWNFQLALRAAGYGTCITTLHLRHFEEVDRMLGIPDSYTQGCLLPVARLRNPALGRPAPRKPLSEVTAVDHWDGEPLTD